MNITINPTNRPLTWFAISQSACLAPLLTAVDQTFRPLSLHTHACNLLSEQGDLVALVTPRHGTGPFHIVAPPSLLGQIQIDDLASLDRATFYFPHFQLCLQGVPVWAPRLPAFTTPVSINSLQMLSEVIINHITSAPLYPQPVHPSPATKRAEQGIPSLLQGLKNYDKAALATGIHLLAGLGPGLTPAGDDFLLGVLAALQMAPPDIHTAARLALCQQISAMAAAQTTRLSAAWLQYAGVGEFGERWHQLQAALTHEQSAQIQMAAQAILEQGASSGLTALLGFLLAQRYVQQSQEGLLQLVAQIQLARDLIGGQVKGG